METVVFIIIVYIFSGESHAENTKRILIVFERWHV